MKKSILKTIIETLTEQVQYMQSCLDGKKYIIDCLNGEIDQLNQQIIDIQNREHQLQKMFDNKCNEIIELRTESNKKRAPLTPQMMSFVMDPSMYLSRKIELIKNVRSCTGMGLKEAKEFVDAHVNDFQDFVTRMGISAKYDSTAAVTVFRRKPDDEFNNEQAGR